MEKEFTTFDLLDMKAGVVLYEGTKAVKNFTCKAEQFTDGPHCFQTDSASWSVGLNAERLSGYENSYECTITFEVVDGFQEECACTLEFESKEWTRDGYVFMPGAVYNGNRFKSIKTGYPPLITNICDMDVDFETTITDIPRLSDQGNYSRIDLLTGDMSTPAIGIYDYVNKIGFLLLTEQETNLNTIGISFEEHLEKNTAHITIQSPGIRGDTIYSSCNMEILNVEDKGMDMKRGDTMEHKVRIHNFECKGVTALFEYFLKTRKELSNEVHLENTLPFSHAWKIQERVYNSERWDNDGNYFYSFPKGYMSNMMDYQLGWVGGLMCTHAFVLEGNQLSKERAVKNLDMVFTKTQAQSGFFYGSGNSGNFYGDGIWEYHWPLNMHSIRKSGDALYFMIKQCMALEKTDNLWRTPDHWKCGIRILAEAFVRLWKRYGQFGQIIDIETGDICIGGSTAGAIVPAGLTLAAEYLGNETYLKVAMASAEYYYKNSTSKGVTTGGPIEILQCPDSESAFALVESFVVIYESTLEEKWLKMASDAAAQFASWCVSYDYKWPKGAEFGRLGINTTGSVVANVQNKHSAPGICTLSGDALFKLYRATRNEEYLELIQKTAHNLPQYLSREDRPIETWDGRQLPEGWMCERVNLSDWEGGDKIGGVFYCYCWCEVSNMLTWAELPGIYIQTDTKLICVFDHVEAKIIGDSSDRLELMITNTTKFDAVVKVFAEKSSDLKKPLNQNWLHGCMRIAIPKGESVIIEIE